MQHNSPPAFNEFIYDYPLGFIDIIYLQIKIIIDNITGSSNKNRRKDQQKKNKVFSAAGHLHKKRLIHTIIKKQLGNYDEYKIGPSYQSEKCSS